MSSPVTTSILASFTAMALLNTPPGSYIRKPLTLLFLLFSLSSFLSCANGTLAYPLADTLSKGIIIFVLHDLSLLYIHNYQPSPPNRKSWSKQLHTTYKMLFNARWLPTPPPTAQNSNSKPTRLSFILRRSFYATFLLSIDTVQSLLFLLLIGRLRSDNLPSKQVYIRRLLGGNGVSTRETTIRAYTAFSGFWSAYVLYTSLHCLIACVCVGIGLDEPGDWPPLFGKVGEAYTVRRFWSKYCDRVFYRTFSTWLKVLLGPVLGVKRSVGGGAGSGNEKVDGEWTGWRRSVLNFSIFFSSGLMHVGVSKHLGYRCGGKEEMLWWCGNFFAIVAETIVQGVARRWFGNGARIRGLKRLVGYVWVAGFLFWSVPKYLYVQMLCAPKEIEGLLGLRDGGVLA